MVHSAVYYTFKFFMNISRIFGLLLYNFPSTLLLKIITEEWGSDITPEQIFIILIKKGKKLEKRNSTLLRNTPTVHPNDDEMYFI